MPHACPIRRLLFTIATFSLLAILAASSDAADMELYAGFDNTTKSGVWSPIGVKLTNPGGKTIEGVLEVRQNVPNRRTMPVCAAKVSLPGNSTKLYYVYTRRQEYGGNVTVSLMHGTRTVLSKNVNPTTVYRYDKMIVSLGDRSSKLSFLSGERIPLQANAGTGANAPGIPSSGRTDATIQAASLSPLMLPDRPAAYQAIDVMVVSDLGSASVEPKALRAITMWVASGGTLVVSTGPNYRSFQTEFFNDLLPVTITGTTSLPTMSTLGQMGKSTFLRGPVAVAKSAPKPGICTQALNEGGVPIYAERRYGAGRVVFLAFDYKASPFRDWNGQTDFWKSLIAASSADVLMPEDSEWWQSGNYGGYNPGPPGAVASLSDVVEQNPSIRTPSFNVIALYLLAYLVFLVPVNYWYLKKKRRMELAWISTPVIVLAFTFGAYAIGYTMKGGRIEMGVATVIEGSSNCRYARTISDASLFSPSRRSYNIEIKDPYAVAQTLPQEASEAMPTAYVGEKTTLEDVSMAMWSSKAVESVSGVDLGGTVVSKVSLVGKQLQGTITNNTNLDLKDCAIQFGANRQIVGDLPRGQTAKVQTTSVSVTAGGLPRPYRGYARDVRSKLDQLAGTSASAAGGPVLIGFATRGAPYGLENRRSKITSETCCLFRLDVTMGDAYIFSPNMIMAYLQKTQNVQPADASGTPTASIPGGLSMNVNPGGYFVVIYQLPVSGGFELTGLTLNHAESRPYGGGGTPSVRYSFATAAGNWESGVLDNNDSAPFPGKYLQPGNRVMLKVESQDGQEITTSVSISAMGKRK